MSRYPTRSRPSSSLSRTGADHGNSRRAHHLGGDRPSLQQSILRRLIEDSLAGRETAHTVVNALGGAQYGARVLALRSAGWIIISRVERVGRSARGYFRIDLDAMRKIGAHDLLALIHPEEYTGKSVAVTQSVPPGPLFPDTAEYWRVGRDKATRPLFGEGVR